VDHIYIYIKKTINNASSTFYSFLENKDLIFFQFKNYFLPKTFKKYYKHLDKCIHDYQNPKKKTLKKSKLTQSQNDSRGLISFLGQLEGKKTYYLYETID